MQEIDFRQPNKLISRHASNLKNYYKNKEILLLKEANRQTNPSVLEYFSKENENSADLQDSIDFMQSTNVGRNSKLAGNQVGSIEDTRRSINNSTTVKQREEHFSLQEYKSNGGSKQYQSKSTKNLQKL